MSYSYKEVRTLKEDLLDRISWTDQVRNDPSIADTQNVIMGNQKVIMRTLKILLDNLPMPYDPGPNG